jgi:cell division protein FtsA
MARKIITGIDIGSSTVKTVIAEANADEKQINVLGTGISPSHGLRKGYVINPNDVAFAIEKSVEEAQENSGLTIRNAFVSIGGIGLQAIASKGTVIIARADHEITEKDLERAIEQSEIQLNRASNHLLNRTIIHRFSLWHKIDGNLALGDPVGMKGEKLETETLFITCLNQHLANLIRSLELSKTRIEDIIAAPWAMSHQLLNQKEKEVGSLLLDIGGDTSSIIVFEESKPISLETLPLGSNHISYDIARGFQVSLNEAEQLKISYGKDPFLARKLDNIIEPRLKDIFELVEKHLSRIKRSQLLPAGIILTGGGANLLKIEEIAKKSLGLPVQIGRPKFIKNAEDPICKNPVWSIALGLCLVGFLDEGGSNLATVGGLMTKIKSTLSKCVKIFLP